MGLPPKRKQKYSNHPFSGATVDGRNPAPVDRYSLSHYFQGFIHPRWCRISSINSMLVSGRLYMAFQHRFPYPMMDMNDAASPGDVLDCCMVMPGPGDLQLFKRLKNP